MAGDNIRQDKLSMAIDGAISAAAALASQDKRAMGKSLSRVARGIRAGRGLKQLWEEYQRLVDEDRIDDSYQESPDTEHSLHELFDYWERGVPDEKTFYLMKQIFFANGVHHKESLDGVEAQHNSLEAYYLLRTAKSLSGGAVHLLGICTTPLDEFAGHNGTQSAIAWLKAVLMKYPQLGSIQAVEFSELELVEAKVFTKRQYADDSGVELDNGNRLTDYGKRLVSFVESAECQILSE